VFDAKAKTQVLQTDQRMQMKVAVHDAVTRVHQWNPFLLQAVPAEIQYLVLQVRRDNLAYDTLGALLQTNRTELKKPLKVSTGMKFNFFIASAFIFITIIQVKFFGEEAEDAGGVRKEFFMLLLKEILDPKYGMFTDYQETHAIWFSEMEFGEQQMYHLIGIGHLHFSLHFGPISFTVKLIPFLEHVLKEHKFCILKPRFALWTGHLQLHYHQLAISAGSVQEIARGTRPTGRSGRTFSNFTKVRKSISCPVRVDTSPGDQGAADQ
jgi:hypothetical protein